MDETSRPSTGVAEQTGADLRFQRLIDAIHAAPSANEIIEQLRAQILDVCEVEMASIFLVDAVKRQLVSWILLPGESLRKIRVGVDKTSIVGYCAATRSMVLVGDPYDSEELRDIDDELRFDSSWDRKAGSRTRQVLAVPILFQHSLMGVIQLMNPAGGREFTAADCRHVVQLAETLALAFRNLQQVSQRVPTRYDLLIKNNLISDKELDRALALANQNKEDVEQILTSEFGIRREDLGKALATFYNTIFVDLGWTRVDVEGLYGGLNLDYLRTNRVVPLRVEEGRVVLAAADPNDLASISEIQQVFGADHVEVFLALPSDIDAFLEQVQVPVGEGKEQGEQSLPKGAESVPDDSGGGDGERVALQDSERRPVVMLVRRIIEEACCRGASAIHIEPCGTVCDAEVRFRIDGQCRSALTVPGRYVKPVVARFKALAGLEIAGRRPQEGRIEYRTAAGRDIELFVTAIPTADGNEDVVLRVPTDHRPLPLRELLPERILRRFEPLIRQPRGIILVAGPPDSGRTTILHSALGFINTPDKKIWTVEDPEAITLPRLRQVEVRPQIGFTCASALRAILGADPDVIMVGGMEDEETARAGIEASEAGHLVLSTLDSPSAADAVVRLLGMGLDPARLAAALQGILARRLVRTLCPECRQAYHPDKNEFEQLKTKYGQGFDEQVGVQYGKNLVLYRPGGCAQCNNTGYAGRTGVCELLAKDEALSKLIMVQAPAEQIRAGAVAGGMTTLLQEGIQLVFAGRTDLDEVMGLCSP